MNILPRKYPEKRRVDQEYQLLPQNASLGEQDKACHSISASVCRILSIQGIRRRPRPADDTETRNVKTIEKLMKPNGDNDMKHGSNAARVCCEKGLVVDVQVIPGEHLQPDHCRWDRYRGSYSMFGYVRVLILIQTCNDAMFTNFNIQTPQGNLLLKLI